MPYSKTTWVDNTTPAISAANLNKMESGIARLVTYDLVADYSCVGDGSTDDTTNFQAAITAAQAVNGLVVAPVGKTFLISSTITVGGSCTIDLAGSTVKKKSTMTTAACDITTGTVTIRRMTLDGNRAAGATGYGFRWSGTTTVGLTEDVQVLNVGGHGVSFGESATMAGGVVTCRRVTAQNCNLGNNYDGFNVQGGAVVNFEKCYGNFNGRAGFRLESGAGDNCTFSDCATSTNMVYGLFIQSNKGVCGTFTSLHDHSYGLWLENPTTTAGSKGSFWDFGTVTASYCGVLTGSGHAAWPDGTTADSAEGTGVELAGAQNNNFGTVIASGNNGYGLAIYGNNALNPTPGGSYNKFGNVILDGTGSTDSDPGCSMGGEASYNYIGNLFVKSYTSALTIGEDSWPLPLPSNPINVNKHNYIASLYMMNCAYAGVLINIGRYNRIDSIVARNCYDVQNTVANPGRIAKGIVDFDPDRGSQNNKTTVTATGMTGNAVSPIVVTCASHTFNTGNIVTITGTVGETAANNTWIITRVSGTQFSLNGSTGNGTWTSGGTCIGNAADTSWVAYNVVGSIDHKTESGTKPTVIAHASGNALQNSVLAMRHSGDFTDAAAILDESNAGNKNVLNNDVGRYVSAATSWTPGAIANGASATTTITVTGAVVGDAADAAYDQALSAGLFINADVSAANTVRCTITNTSGGSLTPTAGNVTASVYKKIN